ncbi:DUF1211 domain-containing protein [Dactylosporangium vinaceum]|uniref:TMEM175 family protein n=1 Tax=Dactylosporangium vinaceum TaxID=53362 RepID=A0ABV5MFY1_9ACTN|nr:TMEM175 family protein [Dactylosporangium vinaceum]UAB98881.1 DUF1211 domain-containing protein [Dactylosporangium vinaceum]
MTTSYPRIAGQSLERLAALSDGIFAVALTLLVLDLRVPVGEVTGQHPVWTAQGRSADRAAWEVLVEVGPHFLPFVMSFMTLGIFWIGQQTQLNHFARTDRHLTWIHLAFLALVCLMPFSTNFVGEYPTARIPFVTYWLNLLLLGLVLMASLRYAARHGMFKTDDVLGALRRRIVFYQACYAGAMALSLVDTYVSMGALVLLQLLSALAPPIPPFDRY